MKYRADIDGLRAVAVMLVLIFHFDLIVEGKAGFIGVDVFFVISGYLITSIISKQLNEGTFRLGTFYVRRIRRLAPPLCAVLLIVTGAGWLLLFPSEFKELSKQVLYSQTYVANIYFWQNINYFGLQVDNVPLLHMWSLAVEEQFYLFYPFFLIIVYRYFKGYIGLILFTSITISFLLNIIFVDIKPEATFYLFPTRAWELLLGGVLPFIHTKFVRSSKIDEVLGMVGVGLIFSAVYFFDNDVKFPGYFALLPTVGAACLILAGIKSEPITSKILKLSAAVYIGRISYSLYLIHWPVNIFATMIFQENYALSWRFAMFGLSIILSMLIYHLIENSFRHKRIFGLDKRLTYAYFSSLLATGAFFMVVMVTDGIPSRYPDEVVRLANFVDDKELPLSECNHGNKNSNENSFCQIGLPDKKPEWLIYGDSHALATYSAFDEWLKNNNQSGLFAFKHGCPPLMNIHILGDQGVCHEFNNRMTQTLQNRPDIEKVFLISAWIQGAEGILSTNGTQLSEENSLKLFKNQFSSTIKHLKNLNKEIFIWEPVPGAKGNVPITMAKAALTNRPIELMFTLEEYLSTFDFFFNVSRQQKDLITASFSPSDALCGSGNCEVSIEGSPAYSDNAHITKSTANYWADQLDLQINNFSYKILGHENED